jgi:hypothetical protein
MLGHAFAVHHVRQTLVNTTSVTECRFDNAHFTCCMLNQQLLLRLVLRDPLEAIALQ